MDLLIGAISVIGIVAYIALPSSYLTRGYCVFWDWRVLAPYLVANCLIGVAYYAIPLILARFGKALADVPSWVVQLFIVFIFLCGSGHFVKMLMVFWPLQWVEVAVDSLTAVASLGTAIALPVGCRYLLNRPTRAQLEATIADLRQVSIQIETANNSQADRLQGVAERLNEAINRLTVVEAQTLGVAHD